MLDKFIDSLNHTVWQLWYGNLSPDDLLAYLVTVKLEELQQDAKVIEGLQDFLQESSITFEMNMSLNR